MCQIIDVACPFDTRIVEKQREKIEHYQDLKVEIQKMCHHVQDDNLMSPAKLSVSFSHVFIHVHHVFIHEGHEFLTEYRSHRTKTSYVGSFSLKVYHEYPLRMYYDITLERA